MKAKLENPADPIAPVDVNHLALGFAQCYDLFLRQRHYLTGQLGPLWIWCRDLKILLLSYLATTSPWVWMPSGWTRDSSAKVLYGAAAFVERFMWRGGRRIKIVKNLD